MFDTRWRLFRLLRIPISLDAMNNRLLPKPRLDDLIRP